MECANCFIILRVSRALGISDIEAALLQNGFIVGSYISSKSSWTIFIGLDLFPQERKFMGIYSLHTHQDLQAWSPSPYDISSFVSGKSEGLCCSQPCSLRGQDKEVMYLLKAACVLYLPTQSHLKPVCVSMVIQGLTVGRNWIRILRSLYKGSFHLCSDCSRAFCWTYLGSSRLSLRADFWTLLSQRTG